MSNVKKVQTEADRLLKKVNEGLEAYDELHEKLGNAPNASAKERLEGDLKRELKKLQRHREAMKGFMQNDDYKEKTKMQGSRKKIEERMENFRAIEREMKIKAFSNEGLASAALEKTESATEQWLKEAIEECRKKIELLEYEVQKANNSRVRRGKQQQKSEFQVRLELMQTHFLKWESLLRMVNNEELDADEVDDLQESIQKILEDDVDLDMIESMTMYDSFDIPEPKAKPTVSFDANESEEKKASSSKSITKVKTPISSVQTRPSPSTNTPREVFIPAPAFVKAAASNLTSPSMPPPPPSQATARVQSIDVVVQPPPSSSSSPADRNEEEEEEEPVPEWMDEDVDAANDDTFGDNALSSGVAIGTLADMAAATSQVTHDWAAGKASAPVESKCAKVADSDHVSEEKAKPVTAPAPNAWERRAAEQQSRQKAQQQATETAPPLTTSATAMAPVAVSTPLRDSSAAAATTPNNAAQQTRSASSPVVAPVGNSHADPSQSFESIITPGTTVTAAAAPAPKFAPKKIHELFDISLGNLSHTLDVQRQRPYDPPNAIDPIPCFPQEVLPVLSNKDVYHLMDLDTLFFIFYYHQKTHQQYFAAKELKARSYRYHTKQQRWYQRLERPQTASDTEERGAYTFFDFEEKWDQDRTDDFLFEYKYLESELL